MRRALVLSVLLAGCFGGTDPVEETTLPFAQLPEAEPRETTTTSTEPTEATTSTVSPTTTAGANGSSESTCPGGVTRDMSGRDLSDADLQREDLRCTDLTNARLRQANLSNADLSGAIIEGADFREANLSSASLVGVSGDGATFESATMHGANLSNAEFEGADFARADLTGALLREALVAESILTGAILRDTDWTRARYIATVAPQWVQETDWTNAVFADTDLRAEFRGLTNTEFCGDVERLGYNPCLLDGLNFTGATGTVGLNLLTVVGTTFEGSDISFVGGLTTFTDVSFANSTLRGRFFGVEMPGTDFTNASLIEVKFTNTNLTGSVFDGAQFDSVEWNNTTCPDGTLSNDNLGSCENNL